MLHQNNYGGMFGLIPPAITNSGKESVSGLRQLMQVAAAYGRGGGVGLSKGVTGEVLIPPDRQIIYGKIRDDEYGSGSGFGSGVVFGSGDASFYDDDGYLAYAFDEVNPFWPWKGEVIQGISTTMPSTGSGGGVTGGGNFAYPLNQDSIGAGAICALLRAGEHWVIIGVSEASDGSGSGSGMTITCSDGTQYPVSISGNTVTVGDAL